MRCTSCGRKCRPSLEAPARARALVARRVRRASQPDVGVDGAAGAGGTRGGAAQRRAGAGAIPARFRRLAVVEGPGTGRAIQDQNDSGMGAVRRSPAGRARRRVRALADGTDRAACARPTACRSTPSRSPRRLTRAPATTSSPRSRSSRAINIAICGRPSRRHAPNGAQPRQLRFPTSDAQPLANSEVPTPELDLQLG